MTLLQCHPRNSQQHDCRKAASTTKATNRDALPAYPPRMQRLLPAIAERQHQGLVRNDVDHRRAAEMRYNLPIAPLLNSVSPEIEHGQTMAQIALHLIPAQPLQLVLKLMR
jgi:hypothetical protein